MLLAATKAILGIWRLLNTPENSCDGHTQQLYHMHGQNIILKAQEISTVSGNEIIMNSIDNYKK